MVATIANSVAVDKLQVVSTYTINASTPWNGGVGVAQIASVKVKSGRWCYGERGVGD